MVKKIFLFLFNFFLVLLVFFKNQNLYLNILLIQQEIP
jgi:hypothetical protein